MDTTYHVLSKGLGDDNSFTFQDRLLVAVNLVDSGFRLSAESKISKYLISVNLRAIFLFIFEALNLSFCHALVWWNHRPGCHPPIATTPYYYYYYYYYYYLILV